MSKMTGLDVAELCIRAAFRMGLEACDPPGRPPQRRRMAGAPIVRRTRRCLAPGVNRQRQTRGAPSRTRRCWPCTPAA